MPIIQSFSVYHGSKVVEKLNEICPPELTLLMDADVEPSGPGIIRIEPIDNNRQTPPKRACWVCYVVGHKLMIAMGDETNFHHYKHDYFTPHFDYNMKVKHLDPVSVTDGKIEFDYLQAASIILSWIIEGR